MSDKSKVPPMFYPQNPELMKRSILIEIPLSNATGKFSFPNNNELNGKRILSISFPDNTSDNMVAPSGANVVPNACIACTYLTIRRDSDNVILDVSAKYYQETTGDRQVRPINIAKFNPQTSGIVITNTATYTVGESIIMTLEYCDI